MVHVVMPMFVDERHYAMPLHNDTEHHAGAVGSDVLGNKHHRTEVGKSSDHATGFIMASVLDENVWCTVRTSDWHCDMDVVIYVVTGTTA